MTEKAKWKFEGLNGIFLQQRKNVKTASACKQMHLAKRKVCRRTLKNKALTFNSREYVFNNI